MANPAVLVTTTKQNRIVLATQSFYTWVLTNRNKLDKWLVCPDDNSTSPYFSYWTFSYIAPMGGPYTWSAYVELPLPQGEYHYEIYQTETQYDRYLAGTVYGLIEHGLLMVTGTYSEMQSYSGADNRTFQVFNDY